MKAIQVCVAERMERCRTGSDAPSWILICHRRHREGFDDTCMPTGVGRSHVISILLLFISHLGKQEDRPKPMMEAWLQSTVFWTG